MNKFLNTSITKRIGIVITTAVLLGIVALLALVITTSSKSVKVGNLDHLQDALDSRSVIIDNYVKRMESDIERYGNSPIVKKALLDPDNAEIISELQTYTESFAATTGDYEGVFTAEYDTTVLAHTNTAAIGVPFYPEGNPLLDELHTNLFSAKTVVNTGVMVSPASGSQVISASYPIFDGDKPIGMVGTGLFASAFMDQVTSMDIRGLDSCEYIFIDITNNNYLYNADEALISAAVEEEGLLELMSQVTSSKEVSGNYTYKNSSGTKMIAAFSYLPTRNWLLIAQNSEDEVFEEIKLLIISMVVIGILMCAVVAGAIVIVLKPVSRDLVTLENSILRLSNIELDASNDLMVFEGRDDECGKIAAAVTKECAVLKKAIGDINRVLGEMAEGNLAVNVNEHNEYYIGDLSFLSDVLKKINRNLSGVMLQISTAAGQVRSGSEQVSTGAQSLSQGTIEQTSSIEGLAGNIRDIEKAVRINSEECGNANDLVAKTFSQVNVASERMNYLTDAMNKISSSFEKINGIIKTIEDIAFQTNILALNAAVEAARAGEAGKGFAVVADEVRNLAAKSADAVKDTTDLIELSGEAVAEGTQITRQTEEAIAALDEYTSSLKNIVNSISQSGEEQLSMVHNINGEITKISNVVQTTSATAEESAAASEELTGQAASLNDLIGRFRIR